MGFDKELQLCFIANETRKQSTRKYHFKACVLKPRQIIIFTVAKHVGAKTFVLVR